MVRLKRVLLPALLGMAVYWAVLGGEYSWFELRRTRAARTVEAAELARLEAQIDSLRSMADSLETDSATLERLARERYGMVRDGEVLYRFAQPEPPDSAADGTDRR